VHGLHARVRERRSSKTAVGGLSCRISKYFLNVMMILIIAN